MKISGDLCSIADKFGLVMMMMILKLVTEFSCCPNTGLKSTSGTQSTYCLKGIFFYIGIQ